MSRRRGSVAVEMATSPIVAMAERAASCGAGKAILAYIDPDGSRICISMPGMDVLQTAGLLSLCLSDLARFGEDDLEEEEMLD